MSDPLDRRVAALGLPDNIVEEALAEEPGPTPEAVARIREMALAKALAGPEGVRPGPVAPAQAERVRPRRRPIVWIAASAAVLLLTFGVVGPARVIAAAQQLLAYVPGFGLHEREGVQLAAARTVREVRGDRSVEVLGLLASEGSVSVRFQTWGVDFGNEEVSLVDGAGGRLTISGYGLGRSGGPSGTSAQGWYGFTGTINPDTKAFTLIIAGDPEWRVTVPVIPATGLAGLEQFGETITANGYTFAGKILAEEDRAEIVLLAQGGEPGAQITSLGTYWGKLPATRLTSLQVGCHSLSPRETGSAGTMRRLITDPLPAGTERATLTIPVIEVMEKAKATFRLAVADRDVGKTIQVGRVSFKVLRTEVVKENLRIYVDPGPVQAVNFARYWQIHVNGKASSSHTKHNEETGLMEYFEVEIPPRAKNLTVTLQDVYVTIEGPWILDLTVERP